MSSLSSRSRLFPFALACCLPLTSCSIFHKNDTASNGQYASNGNDGHYNPYPAGSQPSSYKYQQYNEAPPPPKYSGGSDEEGSHSKKKTKKKTTHGTHAESSESGSKSKSSHSKSGTKSKSEGTTHSKSGGSSSGRYVVKPHDTLYGIAKKHHTTVSKIKSLNGLSSDVIRDGQKLKLP